MVKGRIVIYGSINVNEIIKDLYNTDSNISISYTIEDNRLIINVANTVDDIYLVLCKYNRLFTAMINLDTTAIVLCYLGGVRYFYNIGDTHDISQKLTNFESYFRINHTNEKEPMTYKTKTDDGFIRYSEFCGIKVIDYAEIDNADNKKLVIYKPVLFNELISGNKIPPTAIVTKNNNFDYEVAYYEEKATITDESIHALLSSNRCYPYMTKFVKKNDRLDIFYLPFTVEENDKYDDCFACSISYDKIISRLADFKQNNSNKF